MNKVILAGRLTKDPEVRYTQTGLAVASFTLAVNRRFTKEKDKQQADFIPIVIWDKLAEVCGNYLVKGTQVLIEGRIQKGGMYICHHHCSIKVLFSKKLKVILKCILK